ncbi:MAG: hypothetical protein C5B59_08055 [Bacteroidetes bacterium]|nr:MAG: hypothetical protein C5B59_08055 [Bacteroidota bacterium]
MQNWHNRKRDAVVTHEDYQKLSPEDKHDFEPSPKAATHHVTQKQGGAHHADDGSTHAADAVQEMDGGLGLAKISHAAVDDSAALAEVLGPTVTEEDTWPEEDFKEASFGEQEPDENDAEKKEVDDEPKPSRRKKKEN